MTGDERALARRLSGIGYPEHAALPPGDDAGGVFWGGAAWLLKTDGFAAGDVRLAGMPEEAIGWRAVTAVASDLLAKLAAPFGFVLALFLPGGGEAERAEAWVRGAARAARAYGAHLLGGDTNRGTPAVVASGFARTQDPLPRGGQEGDFLLLFGDRWGLSGAAIDAHYRGADLAPFPGSGSPGSGPGPGSRFSASSPIVATSRARRIAPTVSPRPSGSFPRRAGWESNSSNCPSTQRFGPTPPPTGPTPKPSSSTAGRSTRRCSRCGPRGGPSSPPGSRPTPYPTPGLAEWPGPWAFA